MSKRKCPIENCCNTYCHQSQKEILECKRRNKVIGIFDINEQNQKAIECLKEVIEELNYGDYPFGTIAKQEVENIIDNKIKKLEGE